MEFKLKRNVLSELLLYDAKSVLREEGPRVKFCLVTLLSSRSLKKVAYCEVFRCGERWNGKIS